MLEEGVCQLLQADGTLNDDLELGGRITLLLVPVDPTYPCVSLLNISEVSDHTADGPSGYVDRRVQIDAWGRSYQAVRDIQERIAQVLEAFTGALPDSDHTFVMAIMRVTIRDDCDSAARIYRRSGDYMITFLQQ